MNALSRLAWATLLVSGVSILASGLTRDAKAGDANGSDGAALMKDLSASFSALDKDIQAGESASISREVDALAALCPRMKDLKPEIHAERGDEFTRHVTHFGELLDEVRLHASKSELGGAAQTFDELRATCVSCHMKFRANNSERGNHPARDNTIVGSVSVRDADGAFRTDRSWALVFLEAQKDAPAYVWQRGTAKLSQKLRQFEPRVLPVIVGTTVEFPNDDTIFHNVFSLSKTKPFDLGLYEPGHTATVSMDRTGLVKVYCNIHPDMCASIVVLANPWYALSDRDGAFVICNVPSGEYTLRAWNDLGAEARQHITLGAAGSSAIVEAKLDLQETLHVVAHNNKFGKAYPEKY
jgi:plastocyanin/cytochrome c556